MEYFKFTVERLVSTPSGNYAVYTNPEGGEVWNTNFGFKEGDVVEMWNYDGYGPERIDVNGVTTWTEQDRQKWWDNYKKRHQSMTELLNRRR